MDPTISSPAHLIKIHLSIFRCKAEMTEETFFVVIEVGRKDELKVFRLTEDSEKRYECIL